MMFDVISEVENFVAIAFIFSVHFTRHEHVVTNWNCLHIVCSIQTCMILRSEIFVVSFCIYLLLLFGGRSVSLRDSTVSIFG